MDLELTRDMKNEDLRKALGSRIKELRKQHAWTQKELAEKLDIRFSLMNKYECGYHVPPIEKLVVIAEIFGTTVDFLVTGNHTDTSPLHNLRLLESFKTAEGFAKEDQETVVKLIEAVEFKSYVEKGLGNRKLKRRAV